MSVKKSA